MDKTSKQVRVQGCLLGVLIQVYLISCSNPWASFCGIWKGQVIGTPYKQPSQKPNREMFKSPAACKNCDWIRKTGTGLIMRKCHVVVMSSLSQQQGLTGSNKAPLACCMLSKTSAQSPPRVLFEPAIKKLTCLPLENDVHDGMNNFVWCTKLLNSTLMYKNLIAS